MSGIHAYASFSVRDCVQRSAITFRETICHQSRRGRAKVAACTLENTAVKSNALTIRSVWLRRSNSRRDRKNTSIFEIDLNSRSLTAAAAAISRRHVSQTRSKSRSRSRSHLRRNRKGGQGPCSEERKRGGAGKGTTTGLGESAPATSHVNIRLCVRYGGVRPVCMETKALPSRTTGVEPLVERPCLPTPWWTSRWNTLLLISRFPSLPFAPASHPLALVLSTSLRDSDSYFPETSRPLIRGLFRLGLSITVGSLRFYRQDGPAQI